MNPKCRCGGRLRRTDIIRVIGEHYTSPIYEDTDPLVAHWRCNKCGVEKQQRKRQPKVAA
jgi:hypothetical protein